MTNELNTFKLAIIYSEIIANRETSVREKCTHGDL